MRVLLMFHHEFVTTTQKWRCKFDQQNMENKGSEQHSHTTLQAMANTTQI